jgi:glycosyltransferase involved in cell wall biosynthesis
MRIAYVCLDHGIPVAGGKGASVHIRSITAALARRGHHVVLVCAKLGEGNPLPPLGAILEVGSDPGNYRSQLEDVFAGERVDVVLERYSLRSGPASSVCRRLDLPLVLEVNAPIVHEAARYRGLVEVDQALATERAVFGSAEAIATVSEALASYARVCAPATPAVCIRNGVDVDAFAHARISRGASRRADARSDLVIGFIGSMKAWHGVDDLLAAFGSLAGDHQAIRLVLAGSGPEEAAVRAQVAAMGLAGRACLLGALPHDQVPGVVAGFDIGVAPYRPSADFYFCPLKVLEYMGAGIPTVFPNIGDLAVIVGDAGIGYHPGSAPDLTEAIRLLIGNPALRAEQAAAARRRRHDYSWERTAERTEKLLRSVLAGRTLTVA